MSWVFSSIVYDYEFLTIYLLVKLVFFSFFNCMISIAIVMFYFIAC